MRNLPNVTRYLLLGNLICWLFAMVMRNYGIDINGIFGLHYVVAEQFHWWQPLTYMFMHANFSHLFCNMFAVWMFGVLLENQWGERRYLTYYLVCGLGAALVQEAVWALLYQSQLSAMTPEAAAFYINPLVTIGASGAVFGILFAFGWLFPEERIFLFLIPIPIRARVFVLLYALIELMAGLGDMAGLAVDNVAHFAHLGGMLFGWLLLLYWRHTDWHEPQWGRKIRAFFRSRRPTRLDSSDSRSRDFSDYHYRKSE